MDSFTINECPCKIKAMMDITNMKPTPCDTTIGEYTNSDASPKEINQIESTEQIEGNGKVTTAEHVLAEPQHSTAYSHHDCKFCDSCCCACTCCPGSCSCDCNACICIIL
eukprot:333716_1